LNKKIESVHETAAAPREAVSEQMKKSSGLAPQAASKADRIKQAEDAMEIVSATVEHTTKSKGSRDRVSSFSNSENVKSNSKDEDISPAVFMQDMMADAGDDTVTPWFDRAQKV
tara:strand:- start:787 stop:1128 length:342 start_codon:yes stop_codon:yes gene_type:complete